MLLQMPIFIALFQVLREMPNYLVPTRATSSSIWFPTWL